MGGICREAAVDARQLHAACSFVQGSGAVSPGLALLSRVDQENKRCDGPQWAERWAHEFSIVVIVMTIIRRRQEVPGRRQAPVGAENGSPGKKPGLPKEGNERRYEQGR